MSQTLTLEQKFESVKGVSPEWERVKHFTWSDLTGMRDENAKLRADNKALLDALKEFVDELPPDRCPDPNCGGDCNLRRRADAAIEQAERP